MKETDERDIFDHFVLNQAQGKNEMALSTLKNFLWILKCAANNIIATVEMMHVKTFIPWPACLTKFPIRLCFEASMCVTFPKQSEHNMRTGGWRFHLPKVSFIPPIFLISIKVSVDLYLQFNVLTAAPGKHSVWETFLVITISVKGKMCVVFGIFTHLLHLHCHAYDAVIYSNFM